MEIIKNPDTMNTDPEYWEKVLVSHGLQEQAGMPPRFWVDRGGPNEKQLRRVLFVGTIQNLAGKEEEMCRRRSGKIKKMGHGPNG